ncbi:protein kinase domain-containing protein [Nocardiopsis terrae]
MSGAEQHSRLAPGFHSPEVLYRGSASTVYRARRDGDDAPVALKVMRDAAGTAETDRLGELTGIPGLVAAVGGGRTSSGRAFVAMDLYPRGDYAAALEDRGPLPLEEVLAVGRSVARALAALHDRGLLHNRVEPGNVLCAPAGAVLADVGGVLPADQRPEPVGPDPVAVAHASPEALRSDRRTPASDVYGLATVLWTLLAGHPPFARGDGGSEDPFAYRERVLAEDPPRLPRADLSAHLREVLDRALSRAPGRRQDAAALAEELGGAPDTGAAVAGPGGAGGEEDPGTTEDPQDAEGSGDPEGPGGRGDVEDLAVPAAPPVDGGDGAGDSVSEDGRSAPDEPPAVGAPAFPERFPADSPELAWAALPGWAGTSAEPPPAASEPGPPRRTASPADRPAPPQPPSPFPEPPEPPGPPGTGTRPHGPAPRRPLFIGVTVAAIAFVAVTLGAVAVLRPGAGGDLVEQVRQDGSSPEAAVSPQEQRSGANSPEEGESGAPAPPADRVEEAAPTDVALEDTGHTVVVSWTDNTGSAAAHQVVGGPAGESPGNLADAEPGAGQARVSGLDPGREYCFVVISVLSVDEIAPSEQVCTERSDSA